MWGFMVSLNNASLSDDYETLLNNVSLSNDYVWNQGPSPHDDIVFTFCTLTETLVRHPKLRTFTFGVLSSEYQKPFLRPLLYLLSLHYNSLSSSSP